MPKISVIIPVYNTEEYIRECLDSVVNQTLKDIEIIVINDASPDNSISIIGEFEKNDSRIKVVDKKQNEGVGIARNDGIKAAAGEFVCFMDSDDMYSSNTALEMLYSAAIENDVKVSGGRIELLSDEGVKLQSNPITDNSVDFYQHGLMNYYDFQYDYGYTSYLFCRNMLLENDILFPTHSRFQDPPFYVQAMVAAGRYYYVDKPIYRYRIISGEAKITAKKTLDLLDGITDNLIFSEKEGLAKLHYLTAMRLYKDASFMAAHNINDDTFPLILEKLITAMNVVNKKMIEEEGYNLPSPFLPEVFSYMRTATMKYENLRNNKIAKMISRFVKH